MDYRELLKKYMNHVSEEEGTFFTYHARLSNRFTSEELAELDNIENDIMTEALQ